MKLLLILRFIKILKLLKIKITIFGILDGAISDGKKKCILVIVKTDDLESFQRYLKLKNKLSLVKINNDKISNFVVNFWRKKMTLFLLYGDRFFVMHYIIKKIKYISHHHELEQLHLLQRVMLEQK